MSIIHVVDLVSDNLPKLLILVMDVASTWYELGLQLGVKEPDLRIIEYNCYHRGALTCLREMLLVWLKMIDPPPSWERLLSSLDHSTVGHPTATLSQEIKQKVGIVSEDVPARPSKYTSKLHHEYYWYLGDNAYIMSARCFHTWKYMSVHVYSVHAYRI
jgi:hypothetical protein